MVEISDDVGGVAADLKQIDPHLKVRFAEAGNPPFFAVYEESDDGRSTHLVLTARAYQTASGTWAGLDQRVVHRVMEIGSSTYDFAAEIVKQNTAADRAQKDRRAETLGPILEHGAFALRKDLGATNRVYVPRSVK